MTLGAPIAGMLDHVLAPPPRAAGSGCRRSSGIWIGPAWLKPARLVSYGTRPRGVAPCHSPRYLDQVETFEVKGGGLIEADTWVFPGSNQVALCGAVGGGNVGVIEGPDNLLVALPGQASRSSRPAHRAHGSASTITSRSPPPCPRPTQPRPDLDRRLRCPSMERYPGRVSLMTTLARPSSRSTDIRSTPAAVPRTRLGPEPDSVLTLNVRIATELLGSFPRRLPDGVEKLADRVRPQLVMISAGFDAHEEDPVGSLGLETQDFDQPPRWS